LLRAQKYDTSSEIFRGACQNVSMPSVQGSIRFPPLEHSPDEFWVILALVPYDSI